MAKPNQPPVETVKPEPKIAKSKRASQQKETAHSVFQPNAAGIDIGAREIYVAVPTGKLTRKGDPPSAGVSSS